VSLNAAAAPEPLTTAVQVNGRESVATSACAHRSRTISVLTDADTLSWCNGRDKVYRAIEWCVVGTNKHEYVCDWYGVSMGI
jgi:hypothetical protein